MTIKASRCCWLLLVIACAFALGGCAESEPGTSIDVSIKPDGKISQQVVLRGIEVTGSASTSLAESGWKATGGTGQRWSHVFANPTEFAEGNERLLDAALDAFAEDEGYRPEVVRPFGISISVADYVVAKRSTASVEVAEIDFEPKECLSCLGAGSGDCPSCDGKGSTKCTFCRGKRTLVCDACDGKGSTDCSSCDSGFTTCSSCEGKGRTYDEYWEEWTDCWSCNGEGKYECYSCGGDGRIECSTCDETGKVECPACEGAGNRECDRCSGSGKISCDVCAGTGDPSVNQIALYERAADKGQLQVAVHMPGVLGKSTSSDKKPVWSLSGEEASDGASLEAESWIINWPMVAGAALALLLVVAAVVFFIVRALRKAMRNRRTVAAPVDSVPALSVVDGTTAILAEDDAATRIMAPVSAATAPAGDKWCTACGTRNRFDASFCTVCGHGFTPAGPLEEESGT